MGKDCFLFVKCYPQGGKRKVETTCRQLLLGALPCFLREEERGGKKRRAITTIYLDSVKRREKRKNPRRLSRRDCSPEQKGEGGGKKGLTGASAFRTPNAAGCSQKKKKRKIARVPPSAD